MPVKFCIAQLGSLSSAVNFKRLNRWRSGLFKVESSNAKYKLPSKSEGMFWQYTDLQLGDAVPTSFGGDLLVLITNVPLEGNYYMRRLSGNRVCISLYEIDEILSYHNIPLEAFLLMRLYEIAIVYLAVAASGGSLPTSEHSITHDDTRGCIFDMTGNKTQIVVSSQAPRLCEECLYEYHKKKVSKDALELANRELKGIKLSVYNRITKYIKRHPIFSLIVTAVIAVGLNIISNNLINWITKVAQLVRNIIEKQSL